MKTSDFYYDLPEELIAQHPAEPRDSSRLLVIDRKTGEWEDKVFTDVLDYLHAGDVLVVNNTKVIPARLIGHRKGFTGEVEFLLLRRIDYTHWRCIVRPGKKLNVGAEVVFSEELSAKVTERGEEGERVVEFIFDGVFEDILSKVGAMPLPPYIKEKLTDNSKYQTVYSKVDGSAAAPTAGLHFTEALLDRIRAKGVKIVEILLHVGLSTFRPVKAENIEDHKMHNEYYEISEEAAKEINLAKTEGRRVISVGTTSVRTLESAADKVGHVTAGSGNTEIFIYPPYEFKIVDALITNFHLPESTLLMLVSAFMGREKILAAYKHAVESKYRFFSFGDACFIH
ncbi:MAG TPA: tRNA preQ1(34) S-adenosylmethionine ribosyltransferase-isomerase QueA [Clostridiales bacterium]|nr:tRNA preQ1(34) S-adenosylmethionine ribosyltransferase-isomerase QueA [Clostridiales bacterium]